MAASVRAQRGIAVAGVLGAVLGSDPSSKARYDTCAVL